MKIFSYFLKAESSTVRITLAYFCCCVNMINTLYCFSFNQILVKVYL